METLTIAKPQVEIDEAVRQLTQQQPEQCTIVHCRYFSNEPAGVRIWPTTFLVEDSGRMCKMIKTFNISLTPLWTFHATEKDYIRFTLVFESLSGSCNTFHLLEKIDQPYNFYSNHISKNSSGVYQAEVFVS